MSTITLAIVLCGIFYILGCFSTASVLAKHFKYKNIYKIGSGLADSENIYRYVSKPLGIICGVIDFAKMFIFLWLIRYILSKTIYHSLGDDVMLFIFGFFYIAGHCLPVCNKFRGGRGVFSYIGLISFFMPYVMLGVVAVAALTVWIFKQYRFAQFFIVLVPPLLCYYITRQHNIVGMMSITALLMGILNYLVSKKCGEL